ncbi:MAG: hypothetical protein ACI32C_04550 [Candidatus Enteromonas sp.]
MKLAKRFRGIAIVVFCLLTMSTVLVFTLGANYPAGYAIGTISGVFSIAVALHCFIHRSFVLGSISLALGILGIILDGFFHLLLAIRRHRIVLVLRVRLAMSEQQRLFSLKGVDSYNSTARPPSVV